MPHKEHPIKESPWKILGVSLEANDEQIRSAYLEKVKAFPPDRSGDQFQKIRDAYTQLKDHYGRSKWLIWGDASDDSLEALLAEGQTQQRRHVGPQPWFTALKHKHKGR
jgi:DnaJ-class molecular chaperone